MDDRDLLERLELYQPGRPDPDLADVDRLRALVSRSPRLSQRLENMRQTDRRISAALYDVAVPGELRGSILARMEARGAAAREPARHRARWLYSGAAALVAASLLVALAWRTLPIRSPSFGTLCEQAIASYRAFPELEPCAGDWSGAEDFPTGFDRTLCNDCKMVEFFGHVVRAYLFSSDNVAVMVLMIPREQFPRGVSLPAATSRSTTGMTVLVATDHDGQFVQVAVIDGDEDDLDEFTVDVPLT